MSTVFPVEFEILAGNGDKSSARLFQGFTRDVSAGGMCIEFKSFGKETEKKLHSPGIFLGLTINPTFSKHPIKAQAKIVWLKKEGSAGESREHPPHQTKYLIGVAYESIPRSAQKRLITHARRMRWLPRLASALGLALFLSLGALWLQNQSLVSENTRLLNDVRLSAVSKSTVAENLVLLNDKRRSLESELSKALAENKREREIRIREQLAGVQRGQTELRQSYKSISEAGRKIEDEALRRMAKWLLSHQHKRTGLVASFEGDPGLEDTAFTYDQALACQVFFLFGEDESAKKVLNFFDKHAQRQDGAFFNSYDTLGGNPQESVVHVGPNMWIGIAALQYERKTKDGLYLGMAERLGDWAIRMQDEEGGLRGGPGISWYGIEHNLDAYAFFGMLSERTREARYAKAQKAVLSWIKKYGYSVRERRLNRGKGDATIATDTFAWAIAALGPAKLKEIEFDPEGIMDFAEKNCAVAVDFKQPSGQTVRVKGFDFAKASNMGRGGVISSEWTAQMVVSYQILSKHFENSREPEKAAGFREKADLYLSELQKLIITSPSRTGQGRGCLPYASSDDVDTGHGWRTPKGASTGSVAGTAYGLFAWKEYNPFELGSKGKDNADL